MLSILLYRKSPDFQESESEGKVTMKKSLLFASLFAAVLSAHAQSPSAGGAGTPGAPAATPPGPAPEGGPRGPRGPGDKPHHGRHGQMDAQKMVDQHIASFDTDKDGKVSRAEFLARQSEAFSKADSNSDGFVTKEELAAQHEKHHAEMAAVRDARRAARSGGPAGAPGAPAGPAGSAPPATSGAAK
jgi:hypothetical protein